MLQAFLRAIVLLILAGFSSSMLLAADPPRKIEGWGEVTDFYEASKFELDKGTLVMTSPLDYVDNYKSNQITAPRVMRRVSGDFTVEVNVVHVDDPKPNSVLGALNDFPTAFHSGTLLIRHDDKNFIRYEQAKMNTYGRPYTGCLLHVYRDGTRVSHPMTAIKSSPVILRLERKGKTLLSSYSQDNGKTWQEFEPQDVEHLPQDLEYGVSMTSNTDPACTVKFKDLKITKAESK
jgi:regulation of enolase protein 1 (concanavalin A-like superfamily)